MFQIRPVTVIMLLHLSLSYNKLQKQMESSNPVYSVNTPASFIMETDDSAFFTCVITLCLHLEAILR
jgi:hypothetical protein